VSTSGKEGSSCSATVGYFASWEKWSAYYDVIAVVGSFFPRLFQVSFEFLDSLVEGSIVTETFRLEQIL
jgi:hypothetical protein